jgi:dihydrofolate reductase
MLVSIVAALDRNGVIGKEGAIPWKLPADQRRFKDLTMGRPIIMGRKTHESIGRALPGRVNIILSRNGNYAAENCMVVRSLGEALAQSKDSDEVFVIGGAEIYAQALPLAGRLYLTYVEGEFEGDARFPAFDAAEWVELSRERFAADADNPFDSTLVVMQRRDST